MGCRQVDESKINSALEGFSHEQLQVLRELGAEELDLLKKVGLRIVMLLKGSKKMD